MKEKAKSKESKIVNPVRKCVTGMILAVILSLIVWSIMLVINIMSTQEASTRSRTCGMKVSSEMLRR